MQIDMSDPREQNRKLAARGLSVLVFAGLVWWGLSVVGIFASASLIRTMGKDPAKTIELANRAEQKYRNQLVAAIVHYTRGVSSLSEMQTEQAAKDGEALVKLMPKLGQGYYVRGVAFLQKGKVKEGLADLTRFAELSPGEKADQALGRAYEMLGEMERAEEFYVRAGELGKTQLAAVRFFLGKSEAPPTATNEQIESVKAIMSTRPEMGKQMVLRWYEKSPGPDAVFALRLLQAWVDEDWAFILANKDRIRTTSLGRVQMGKDAPYEIMAPYLAAMAHSGLEDMAIYICRDIPQTANNLSLAALTLLEIARTHQNRSYLSYAAGPALEALAAGEKGVKPVVYYVLSLTTTGDVGREYHKTFIDKMNMTNPIERRWAEEGYRYVMGGMSDEGKA